MKLKDKVDALIVVPNDRIFTVISKETPVLKAFEAIDDILRNALKGLVEIIALPGIINVDFADVKNIMQDAGVTIIGVATASGQDRAVNAVTMALHSPLLETSPEGAKAVLLGISGGRDLKMTEVNEAAKIVATTADPGARIIFGAYHDKNLRAGQIKVTVIAAGFANGGQPAALFGARYERQPDMFGGREARETKSAVLENFPATALKKPASGRELSGGVAKESAASREEVSSPEPSKPSSKEKKEKESDAWDIPAFLRRRKR